MIEQLSSFVQNLQQKFENVLIRNQAEVPNVFSLVAGVALYQYILRDCILRNFTEVEYIFLV